VILAIAVSVAASLGAVSRYLVDQVVQHQHGQAFPWGTFVINVSGSFLLGLTTGWAAQHGLPPVATTLIGVGFLGGYTTWSTYLWESLALAETGALGQAALNLLGSLVVGAAAATGGFALAFL
jgi:CrcB protein